jgi:hypothetical protein
MFCMMYVMRVDHPLKVTTSFLWSPLQSLVNNNIVKNEVEQSVKKNSQSDGKHVRIVFDEAEIVKQSDRRQAENYREQIIFFKHMVMNRMVGFMPGPEYSMHDKLVREPCNELPEKEGSNNDQAADKNCCDIHAKQTYG